MKEKLFVSGIYLESEEKARLSLMQSKFTNTQKIHIRIEQQRRGTSERRVDCISKTVICCLHQFEECDRDFFYRKRNFGAFQVHKHINTKYIEMLECFIFLTVAKYTTNHRERVEMMPCAFICKKIYETSGKREQVLVVVEVPGKNVSFSDVISFRADGVKIALCVSACI